MRPRKLWLVTPPQLYSTGDCPVPLTTGRQWKVERPEQWRVRHGDEGQDARSSKGRGRPSGLMEIRKIQHAHGNQAPYQSYRTHIKLLLKKGKIAFRVKSGEHYPHRLKNALHGRAAVWGGFAKHGLDGIRQLARVREQEADLP
jgi:hypothetical protein